MRINTNAIARFIRRHGHQIAGALSIIGVGVVSYTSAKAAIKINKKLEEAEEIKGEPLTVEEKIKAVDPKDVIAPAVAIVGTTAAIATGTGAAEVLIAGATAALGKVSRDAQQFKADVSAIDPEVAKEAYEVRAAKIAAEIPTPISAGPNEHLYFDVVSGTYFKSTDDELALRSEHRLNDILSKTGRLTYGQYRAALGLPQTTKSYDISEERSTGWTCDTFAKKCAKYPHLDDPGLMVEGLVLVFWDEYVDEVGDTVTFVDPSYDPEPFDLY